MNATKVESDVFVEAGRLVMFSSGDYSDYGTSACCVTLRPLLKSEMVRIRDEVAAQHKRDDDAPDGWAGDIHEMFQSALIAAGFLLVVDCREWHLGSYGELAA